ncbi:MAG TPA: GspH/FimT family pseudopilin [Longimicrobiales bacterium]
MRRTGHSLIELLLVLAIAAILTGVAAAPLGHARDVLAVRAARDEIVSLAALARSTAVMTGGARLVIDVPAGTAWVETPAGAPVGEVHYPGARHRVSFAAASSPLHIRYDGLGIGRMTNTVLHVRSGRVTGTLTVSAYGRVRQS